MYFVIVILVWMQPDLQTTKTKKDETYSKITILYRYIHIVMDIFGLYSGNLNAFCCWYLFE